MDGGLSHLPEQIPLFIDAMARGYDYAGGSPLHDRRRLRRPWSRYLI